MSQRERIMELIQDKFVRGRELTLDPSDSFIDTGLIDSLGMMELIGLLEGQFKIHVEDEELTPENLDSVEAIDAYLCRKGVN